ncbi:MAG: GNAT family N-acetyltransferase [Clostridia bacterium]|nr:GNAT family N-acetyltransferase [Clostridia bacterium]MBQ4317935.1 GNAT family N-acetyltransferase [Clostridia bacterium]
MIYYNDGKILIRDLCESDAAIITAGEVEQGWDQTIDKYEMRLRDQAEGKSISLAAEYMGNVAGYINVYPDAEWGAFGGMGLPEIVDFGVLEKYRKNGIGSHLMDVAEEIASRYADTVYLGVGVHNGYGSAQRMYVKRGYIPDGSGVWYRNEVCPQYAPCQNDDSLILYFSKKLR